MPLVRISSAQAATKIIAVVMAAATAPGLSQAATLARMTQAGVVTRVVDGDTLWIQLAGRDKPLKVHRASLIENADACPTAGTIVSADPKTGLIISCGTGLLKLEEVQAEGGKRLPAADFLRGHPLEVGTRLA